MEWWNNNRSKLFKFVSLCSNYTFLPPHKDLIFRENPYKRLGPRITHTRSKFNIVMFYNRLLSQTTFHQKTQIFHQGI